jgi:peptidoglycan/LPS O-acetylase OafA/YrhL
MLVHGGPGQNAPVDRGTRMQHQPALDGLRGAAVAGVLLYHAGHLRGGYLGVDAFFVLSGFLITSLLLIERDRSGTVALGAFWARRARRLLPALLAVLAFVALYAAVIASSTERATIRGDALATLGYVANWHAIFSGNDYWALFRSPSPLEHTWSLAIEEQFYLLWPLLLVAVAATPKRVLALAGGLAIASFAWMQLLYDPASPSRVYYGTDTRLASILIGAALAAWAAMRGPVRRATSRAVLEFAAWASVVVLIGAWTTINGSSSRLYRGGLLLTAVAVACVIAAAVHPRRGLTSRVLSFRPLCALGLISYGVYLWHWPLYVWLDERRTHLDGWTLVAVRVAVTLLVATASYFLLERPIRRGAISARTWRPAVPVLAGALVLTLVVATASQSSEGRFRPDPIRAAAPLPISDTGAAAPLPAAQATPTTTVTAPPVRRVLVVGNSVAGFLADDGFKQLPTMPPIDVLNRGQFGCTIMRVQHWRAANGEIEQVPIRYCRDDWTVAARVFRPDVVIVAFAEPTDVDAEIDGTWTAPCESLYDSKLEAELHASVRMFAANRARVVVATAAYARLPNKTPGWLRKNDCQNEVIRDVVASEPSARLADVFAWYCPALEADCRAQVDGVTLRPDGVHFRGRGAEIVARRILDVAGITVATPTSREHR